MTLIGRYPDWNSAPCTQVSFWADGNVVWGEGVTARMGGASAGAQEVQEWAGWDWGMFWAFWAFEDRGWDQRKDTGRFRAGGHPSLAAGGSSQQDRG